MDDSSCELSNGPAKSPCTLCIGRETHHIRQSISQFEVTMVMATRMTAAMVTAALEATAAKIKPEDANPFRKGDAVVYPTHGVGRVDRVGFEEIGGYRLNLIHISFQDNQMTLRVPVARARAAGLRKLTSRTAMAAALATLKGRPRTSRLLWSKRSQEYLTKINTSNPSALAEVVRDLRSAGDGSGSSFSQRNLFELAFDRLAGEFAAVNRIAKLDAIALLNRTLADARADSAVESRRPDVGV
jgi:CarD family transcriptional regulator